jgi:hypothetical protein
VTVAEAVGAEAVGAEAVGNQRIAGHHVAVLGTQARYFKCT